MTKAVVELCLRICRRTTLVATLALLFLHCLARADVVTDWNKNAEKAILNSTLAGSSVPTARVYVLMHAAIFDAVNGIKPQYTPYHVDVDGPQGASTRAAAIQAAYVVLVSLFPSQKSTFDAERATSLASLADDADDSGDDMNITRGLGWGELVANDILTWRSIDGFSRALPRVTGGLGPGNWRPTPPQFLPMVSP